MIKYLPFELHTHTLHSDGSFTVQELADKVISAGLCGYALTDHNTDSGCTEARNISKSLDIAFIEGIEWTTFFGHITVLGGHYDKDYRMVNPLTVEARLKLALEAGDVAILAHPFRVGTPVCTGCCNSFDFKSYQYLNGYEIWSGSDPSNNVSNKQALIFYNELCKEGYKIAAIYGRDWHRNGKRNDIYAATYLGIEGDNKSPLNALLAIENRRTYISTGIRADIFLKNTNGERIEIGSSISEGEYTLVCEVSQEKAQYANYDIIPEKIEIFGNAISDSNISSVSFGGYAKKIKVKKGYLGVKIVGKLNEKESDLLISSPFYVGY